MHVRPYICADCSTISDSPARIRNLRSGAPGQGLQRGRAGDVGAGAEYLSSDLLVGFINSRPHHTQPEELLANGSVVAEWFEAAGATDADAATARELRDALLSILRAHVGCDEGAAMVPAAEAHLQRAALRFPVTTIVTSEGCELHPTGTGIDRSFATCSAPSPTSCRGARGPA
jgi:hypothetical protein